MKLLSFAGRLNALWSGKHLSGSLIAAAGIFLSVCTAADHVSTILTNGTKVPEEVQNIANAYLKDSTGIMSFTYTKRRYHIDSLIKLSDIEAGIPVHEYVLDIDKLMKENASTPVSMVVIATNSWQVPIRAHGKYLYSITISKLKNIFKIGRISPISSGSEDWESARTSWPEDSENIPILIRCDGSAFLHFPQIDGYNLMTLRKGYANEDSVSKAFDESTGDNNPAYASPGIKKRNIIAGKLSKGAYLSDSRKIFKYLIKRQLEFEETKKRMELIHPKENSK